MTPTRPEMADEAFTLFAAAYGRAHCTLPLVPALEGDQEERLRTRVRRAFSFPGAAAWRDGRMVGYLIPSPIFDLRGLPATLVPEHAHAVAPGDERDLYGPLYAEAIEPRVREGAQLHLIGRFDGDGATGSALEELGFGAIVAERLRDLSDVPSAPRTSAPGSVRVDALSPTDAWDDLTEIAAEHAAYYRGSPIFLTKDASLDSARADLEAHRQAGDRLFVARVDEAVGAYLIVGPCTGETEGRLLVGTRTAQVRSAYARPTLRRHGIGSELLQRAVTWARNAGYERLFVEHETANLEGGAFWRRHFRPFLTFSIRYVQATP